MKKPRRRKPTYDELRDEILSLVRLCESLRDQLQRASTYRGDIMKEIGYLSGQVLAARAQRDAAVLQLKNANKKTKAKGAKHRK